ncbi:MAG: PDZ domain-containing protein [Candidatus Hydrogenedentes bacterium]|nr:PDZ domain-containing protein [Candidatus Hydrogenedentota bacterium]
MGRHLRTMVLAATAAISLIVFCSRSARAEEVPDALRSAVENAVAKVKPALVRIHVVFVEYNDGREVKFQASGSGAVIGKEGYVITNHHVAGHATRIQCTFSNKEEMEADLVGTDALTDISVLKLRPDSPRDFPVAEFGDSSRVLVGDNVLAMGSPMALSQSVTLGIVSNTEMIMPKMMQWRFTLDGEDVGSIVRWIGHDAAIYPGNSGGPLVNLNGQIIGINEIDLALSGAIPGNLANTVAQEIIKNGRVKRSWLGLEIQPLLKHSKIDHGVLVSGTMKGSPADKAGIQSGDIIVRLAGKDVNIHFDEEKPGFNRMVADLPIGQEIEVAILRDGKEIPLKVATAEREEASPKQSELKKWGITGRNISFFIAKEMKLDSQEGVLITSVSPGGPAGDAKPKLTQDDVVHDVGGTPIKNVKELSELTAKLTEGKKDPVPTLIGFTRDTEKLVTVVKIGIKDFDDPGLEVRKAWLPIKYQVITKDIAEQLGFPDRKGFRITAVFPESAAERAQLKVGDLIVAVDGAPLTASAPEQLEELPALIRQYKVGTTAELSIIRGKEPMKASIELPQGPPESREMKKHQDTDFEFTVRDISLTDQVSQQWQKDQHGVLVIEIKPGGWAELGRMNVSDLITDIEGTPISSVDGLQSKMKEIAAAKPRSVVLRVLRGVHTLFLELEPNWSTSP